MNNLNNKSGPPHLFLAFSEVARGSMELATLFSTFPLLWTAPKGDGHKVVVLPGFSLDDGATFYLRSYLISLGYDAFGLGMGPNYGPRTFGSENRRLNEFIEGLREGEKVSLVGHSLGGAVAREYARSHPEHIRRVITLGTPFAGDETSMHTGVVWFRRHMTGEDPRLKPDRSPLPVPHTVIYSHTDGVVSAHDCLDHGEEADNVEVVGSHIGLLVNASAFMTIAERLADLGPTPRSVAA